MANGELVLGPPKSEAGVRTLVLPTFLAKELEEHLSRFSGADPSDRVFPASGADPCAVTCSPNTGGPHESQRGFLPASASTISATPRTRSPRRQGPPHGSSCTAWVTHRPKPRCATSTRRRGRDAELAAALGDLVKDDEAGAHCKVRR